MRIILLTDFSPHAQAAASVSLNIAKLERKDIELVHVEDEHESSAHSERMLKTLQDSFQKKGVVAHCITLECDVEEIPTYLKLTAEDLLIMGTHGLNGWKEKWVGTYTQKLLRCSPCPILAVPLSTSNWTLEEILYVSEFDDIALESRLIKKLTTSFKSFMAEIHLLKVFSPDDPKEDTDVSWASQIEADHQSVHTNRLSQFKTLEQAIFEQAKEIDADIIALKTHQHSSWFLRFIGSIAESVLIQSDVPVWVQRIANES